MLVDQKKFDDALAHINTAIKADPGSVPAYFARGKVWALMARWDDAKDAFNQVLKLNPRAASAQVELSKLHLQSGATDVAVTLAGAAVTSDPRRADARLILARGLIARGDFGQAQTILADLQRGMPDSAIIHAQLGWLHLAKKENPEATAEFQHALKIDPLQLDAVSGIVAQDMATGRKAEAIARLDAMVKDAPSNAALLTLSGRTNATAGNLDVAQSLLSKAIATDPNSLDAYSYLGEVYLRQNRIEDARREFENRAQLEMHPVAALTMVGLIYQMQNRTTDAQHMFEKVLEIDPKSSVAANNLAWIYAENGGNLDVALQLAQTAQASLPNSAEATDTLGYIYMKKQLYELSISTLKRAVDSEPKNAAFQYHLGLAYAKYGDKDKAKPIIETALRLKSDFTGADDAKRLLAGL
jgi:tetratricopeptide (TPR) repeat protein